MRISRYFILVILCLASCDIWGQRTPEELGDLVFRTFKNTDYLALDTLTLKPSELGEVFRQRDTSLHFMEKEDFPLKQEYHDKKFKEKCKKLMKDTAYFKIDWKEIKLVRVEYYEKELIIEQDSNSKQKPFIRNYLDIYITSKNEEFLLQFKSIYKYNGIWKLGEHVRFNKSKEE